jgi:hypothetical protein
MNGSGWSKYKTVRVEADIFFLRNKKNRSRSKVIGETGLKQRLLSMIHSSRQGNGRDSTTYQQWKVEILTLPDV